MFTIRLGFSLIAAVIGLSATPGFAADTYTGCLTPKGTIAKVAIGTEPAKPCNSRQTQISWAQEGPPGPKGDTGLIGPEGPQGKIPSLHDATGQYLGDIASIVLSGPKTYFTLYSEETGKVIEILEEHSGEIVLTGAETIFFTDDNCSGTPLVYSHARSRWRIFNSVDSDTKFFEVTGVTDMDIQALYYLGPFDCQIGEVPTTLVGGETYYLREVGPLFNMPLTPPLEIR